MTALIFTIIAFAFVFLVVFGALRDLSTFRIPNWVSYGIIGLFALHAVFESLVLPPAFDYSLGMPEILVKLLIGLFVFLVALIFWARGYIGGGDAKFLVATAIWMGPEGVVTFMVFVSGLSLLMALALKLSRNWGFIVHAGKLPLFVKRLYSKLEEGQLPFGFPIGIATLLMVPQIFSL